VVKAERAGGTTDGLNRRRRWRAAAQTPEVARVRGAAAPQEWLINVPANNWQYL